MNIDWAAVRHCFSDMWAEIVLFRGAHPLVAAVAVAFVAGLLVGFCAR